MAETSKNKIYYNDDENSVADVLTDMKKMAESTDKAIENSKYDDAQIKKDISDAKKEQALKDAEQDNKIIELQNEKAELEKELKEAQEDFYQNSIRGQASGEYIHVEDSNNCRAKIGISGNSEQETREGYNLLDFKETNTAITKNGLNYKKNSDGSIEVSGTTNKAGDYTMANKYTFKAGKTYTVMANVTAQNPPIFYFKFNSANGGVKNVSNGSKTTITIKEDEELNLMWSQGVNSTVNFKAYILLYEGTEDKPYEQYGASPSPNYQSEVKSVGSNVNEFDINTVKNALLNEKTGEKISNNDWRCSDFIEILNKTYTFGWKSSSSYFQVKICYYDENKKFLSGKSYSLNNTFNITFEVVNNAKYMKIAYSVLVSR